MTKLMLSLIVILSVVTVDIYGYKSYKQSDKFKLNYIIYIVTTTIGGVILMTVIWSSE